MIGFEGSFIEIILSCGTAELKINFNHEIFSLCFIK